METGNNQYLITVSGEKIKSFTMQEVLPEALVEDADKRKNRLSQRILMLWFRHSANNVNYNKYAAKLHWSNLQFDVVQRNV